LEEAIATAKGNPNHTAPTTQNPYLVAALPKPKDPPRELIVIKSSQPSGTYQAPPPDPLPFACLAATRPVYPAIPDPTPK
jgi:hypothetical protein